MRALGNIFKLAALILFLSCCRTEILVDEFYPVNTACYLESLPTTTSIFQCQKEDSDMCLVCNKDYFLLEGSCYLKIQNCKYQTIEDVCELCADGYAPRIIGNKRIYDGCLNTVANCQLYTPFSTCYVCQSGYYLQEGACILSTLVPTNAATALLANCIEKDYAGICIRTNESYAFDASYNIISNKLSFCSKYSITKICIRCHPGYSLTSSGACILLSESLLPFNWMFAAVTQSTDITCINTYNIIFNVLTIQTSSSDATVKIQACIKEDSSYSNAYFAEVDCVDGKYSIFNQIYFVCTLCSTGTYSYYVDQSQTNPPPQKALCMTMLDDICLFFLTPTKCLKCKAGYVLNSAQVCVQRMSCGEGMYFSANQKGCVAKTGNCLVQLSDDTCEVCACGYYFSVQSSSCVAVPQVSVSFCQQEYVYEKSVMISASESLGCYKCNVGYSRTSTGTCKLSTVDTCDNESYQVWYTDSCEFLDSCAKVAVKSQTACLRCLAGYYINTDGNCVDSLKCLVYSADYSLCLICLNSATSVLMNGVCYAYIENCVTYSVSGSALLCEQCKPFYFTLTDKKHCYFTSQLTSNCQSWSGTGCSDCNSFKYSLTGATINARMLLADNQSDTSMLSQSSSSSSSRYLTTSPVDIPMSSAVSISTKTCVLNTSYSHCSTFVQNVCKSCDDPTKYYYNPTTKTCVSIGSCSESTACSSTTCTSILFGFSEEGACVDSTNRVPYCKSYQQSTETTSLYTCLKCHTGYIITVDKTQCIVSSIANCAAVVNTSYDLNALCSACDSGYKLSADSKTCTSNPSNNSQQNTNSMRLRSISGFIIVLLMLMLV